jgi:hypothetical protein
MISSHTYSHVVTVSLDGIPTAESPFEIVVVPSSVPSEAEAGAVFFARRLIVMLFRPGFGLFAMPELFVGHSVAEEIAVATA